MKPLSRTMRPTLAQPLFLSTALILAILIGGLLAVRSMRAWREEVVSTNMDHAARGAAVLAADAEEYLKQLPELYDAQGFFRIAAPADSLDLQLTLLSTRVFGQQPGLKGGFWLLQENEFLGYANPWSPPPTPEFGPPPRSYALILEQVSETIRTLEPITRLHQFESVSVAGAVFPLATMPVFRDGNLVAVAWARIHIEAELPARRLGRYLNVTAIVAISAFLVTLLTSLYQRREIRSLNQNLKLIEQNPAHRMTQREGMFGSIREAINRMVESLDAENRRRLALEEQLHQQDKMAALGQLLAAVAHEVKTPLAILKTRIQIWQRDLKNYERDTGNPVPLKDDSIRIALNEINRLSDLLRKLLYFSKPVRTDQVVPLEADDLIRHSVLFVKPRIVQKRMDLDIDLNAQQARILGEADSLHQLFLNVLTNSLEMSEEGSLISVASRVDESAETLVIDLMDNGPGLTPEVREQAFTPFFSGRQGGSGLGLSIAYEIVQAHDGTIEFLEPEGGTGAHCRVVFPLHRSESEPS